MIDTESNFDSVLTSRRAGILVLTTSRLGFQYWLLSRVNSCEVPPGTDIKKCQIKWRQGLFKICNYISKKEEQTLRCQKQKGTKSQSHIVRVRFIAVVTRATRRCYLTRNLPYCEHPCQHPTKTGAEVLGRAVQVRPLHKTRFLKLSPISKGYKKSIPTSCLCSNA